MTWDMLISVALWSFRVLAGALSFIAVVQIARQWRGQERPAYDRRRNDIAWAWMHAGCALGMVAFVVLGLTYRPIGADPVGDLFVALVWWCFANGVTVRMAAKVCNPRGVYVAATIFLAVGALVTLAKAMGA